MEQGRKDIVEPALVFQLGDMGDAPFVCGILWHLSYVQTGCLKG